MWAFHTATVPEVKKLRHKTQLIKLSISDLYVDLTLNPPGIAGPKQPLELAGLPFLRLSDLSGHQLVIDPALHVPEDAYRRRAARFARQPAQREREARLHVARVVDYQLRLVPHLHDLNGAVRALPHALLAVLAEADRLAVLQVDPVRLVVAHEV